MGSWVLYGLGSECDDLPGFVVLMSAGKGGQMQPIASRQWSAGILASKFQGVKFNSAGDPGALHQYSRRGWDGRARRVYRGHQQTESPGRHHAARSGDSDSRRPIRDGLPDASQRSRPDGYEQRAASAVDAYGAKPGDGSFASNCLLARRLAERGVRFIQLYHRDWDHHSDIKGNIPFKAEETDRATAALITDLKQRGMLDDTLVIWGGEFGRTPMSQGDGRDHHIKGFSFMVAGGGIQRRHDLRRDGRTRLRRCRKCGWRSRFSRDNVIPTRHRSQKHLHGQIPRPRRPPNIYLWGGRKTNPCLTSYLLVFVFQHKRDLQVHSILDNLPLVDRRPSDLAPMRP